jgi:hypothetical protein
LFRDIIMDRLYMMTLLIDLNEKCAAVSFKPKGTALAFKKVYL